MGIYAVSVPRTTVAPRPVSDVHTLAAQAAHPSRRTRELTGIAAIQLETLFRCGLRITRLGQFLEYQLDVGKFVKRIENRSGKLKMQFLMVARL